MAIVRDDLAGTTRSVLISPAELATPQIVNLAISNAKNALTGGICHVAISEQRASALRLQRMANLRDSIMFGRNYTTTSKNDLSNLALCVSVESREGVTTGISAADRARTISVLGERTPDATKLISPGHIFPIIAREGGVLVKVALHEAALDLVKIAGFTDAALLIDLLDHNGELATNDLVQSIALELKLPLINISELIRYRLETERLVQRQAETLLPSRFASDLRAISYSAAVHAGEHLALVKGEINPDIPTLVRVQPEFTFGDVFGGPNPPTRNLIHSCLNQIERQGSGVLVYLRRASGGELGQQVGSWAREFQERPRTNMREYGLGAQILRDLGVKKIDLLTNSRNIIPGVKSFGIEIISTRPITK